VIIKQDGYTPVECDEPLPCPFCGSQPVLSQLEHYYRQERIGRSRKYRTVRIAVIASTRIQKADTFWFACEKCGCTTGGHHETAQAAALAWNKRDGGAK